jgi:hypothetical protein
VLGQIYERRHSISRARATNGLREEGIKTREEGIRTREEGIKTREEGIKTRDHHGCKESGLSVVNLFCLAVGMHM